MVKPGSDWRARFFGRRTPGLDAGYAFRQRPAGRRRSDWAGELPARLCTILIYPVISLDAPFTHGGSKTNLLGKDPDPKLVASLSNDTQVTAETPPTFLVHSTEDTAVPPENSIAFYAALRKAKVPAEMHIYEKGPHGLGLAPNQAGMKNGPAACADWLTHPRSS